jgi:hypothetical protein
MNPPDLDRITKALAARDAVKQAGGDPAALDAIATLRSQTVAGILLFANPPATYSALRLVRDFFPPALDEADANSMDRIIAMVYAFARPVRAFLEARKGADIYLAAAMEWAGESFPDDGTGYQLGQCAGWCIGILATLSSLSASEPDPDQPDPQ